MPTTLLTAAHTGVWGEDWPALARTPRERKISLSLGHLHSYYTNHQKGVEMSGLEARPPTAPESWLRVGSAPPLGIKASTTSHPTSQVGSERDSTPDTARAQTPYPSDRTGPPRSSPHTITHRQIECLSQADSTDKERREREEREREERGEGAGVCTREEWGGCLWWAVVIQRG